MNTRKILVRILSWGAWVGGVVTVIAGFYFLEVMDHEAEGNVVQRRGGEIVYELQPSPLEQKLFERKIRKTMKRFEGQIKLVASRYHRDWRKVLSVVVWESAGDPCKISQTGDVGLMQLQPATAAEVGVAQDLCHPYKNLSAGTRYLNRVRDEYGNSAFPMQLVAYNRGPTGARKWFKEKNALAYPYTRNVLKVYWVVRRMYPQ